VSDIQDTTVLILGLGASGLAMARCCAGQGARVRVWDSRETPPQAEALAADVPGSAFFSGELTASALDGIACVYKSPGLSPLDERLAALLAAARDESVPVRGELDLFAQALAKLRDERGYAPKVIAITGTNGKTTTTSLAGQLVERAGRRVAVAGNIGPTMLDTLAAAIVAQDTADAEAARKAAEEAAEEAAAQAALEQAEGRVAEAAEDAAAEDLSDGTIAHEAEDAAARALESDAAPAGDGGEAAPEAAPAAEPAEAAATEVAASAAERIAADDVAAVAVPSDGAPAAEAPVDTAEPIEEPPPAASADETPAPAEEPPADEPPAIAEAAVAAASASLPDDDAPAIVLIPPPPPAPVFSDLPEVWVLELSSFQLDGVQGFEPDAATVLNVTQDHLDWHGTMKGYADAKARIYGTTPSPRTLMVVNRDDPAVEAMVPSPVVVKAATRGARSKTVSRRVTRFGLDAPRAPGDFGLVVESGMAWLVRALERDETIKLKPGEAEEIVLQRLMPADALRIRGRHNASNALAALALATGVGLPLAPMLHGLRDYRGEPHRVEPIGQIGDVEFFDDSKGTNVGATVAALAGLGADRAPARLVVILGGDGKGQDFEPLGDPLRRFARAAATIGQDAEAIEAVLQSNGVHFQRHATLEEATRWAHAQAEPGDAVLLSPACASFDMFKGYAHRAQVFCDAMKALAEDRGEVQ
jgi:UDP-N-acetylmuramoylalanine--D-glutamate ligase